MYLDYIRKATAVFAWFKEDEPAKVVGSGVVVNEGRHVVTAKHVLTEMEEKSRTYGPEGWTPTVMSPRDFIPPTTRDSDDSATIQLRHFGFRLEKLTYSRADTADIAAVDIPDDTLGNACAEIDFGCKPAEGDRVLTCGWPMGEVMHDQMVSSFIFGRVSNIAPHASAPIEAVSGYTLQMPACPGNSGGAVYHERTGYLIGVISSGQSRKLPTSDNLYVTGFIRVVPIGTLYDVLST